MKPRKEHYRKKLPHFQQPGQWYFVTCILKGAMPKGALNKYATKLEAAKNLYLLLKEKASTPGDGVSGDGVSNSGISLLNDLESPTPGRPPTPQAATQQNSQLAQARKDYYTAVRKYRLAYDKILHPSQESTINLTKENNRKIIEEALLFWEGKRLKNHAWCIMSNHFHWVLSVFEWEPGESESNLRLGESQSWGESQSRGKPVYLQDILHSVKLFSARRINQNENRTGQLWEHESFETTIRNERHFTTVVNYTLNNPVAAGLVKEWTEWTGTRTFLNP